jgi:alpha-beta hydrolase superfamily lysophospholipase
MTFHHGFRRNARSGLLVLLMLTVTGCARLVLPAGPDVRSAAIEAFTPPEQPRRPSPWALVPPLPPPTPAGPVPAEALVMADGTTLALRVWAPRLPPRAVILALHGFGDHGGNSFVEGGPLLNAAGILVYAYDQRGFGYSTQRGIWPGVATLVEDARAATRLIAARHPDLPLFLMGESMGGAIVAVAGTQPLPVRGYILAAPAVLGRSQLPWVASAMLDGLVRLIPAMAMPATAGGIAASDNRAALLRFGRDPLTIREARLDLVAGVLDSMDAAVAALPQCCTAPSLILTGGQDQVIPTRVARRVLRTLPHRADRRILHYPDGWHLLLRDVIRETVAADIVSWVADPAAPLAAEAAAAAWLR